MAERRRGGTAEKIRADVRQSWGTRNYLTLIRDDHWTFDDLLGHNLATNLGPTKAMLNTQEDCAQICMIFLRSFVSELAPRCYV